MGPSKKIMEIKQYSTACGVSTKYKEVQNVINIRERCIQRVGSSMDMFNHATRSLPRGRVQHTLTVVV